MRWLVAAALGVLSTIDILLTRQALSLGGVELNLIVRPWVETDGFLLVKTAGVLAVALLVAWRARPVWLVRFMYLVAAVYVVVVSWNVGQFLMAGVWT